MRALDLFVLLSSLSIRLVRIAHTHTHTGIQIRTPSSFTSNTVHQMSSNTATGALASHVASDEATALRRKAVEKCQLLLETLYDSYNGYKQCAEDCKDATAKLLFQKIAASRSDLIAQLSNVIKVDLGTDP